MSRFPRTEAEITALALLVVEGLTQAPEEEDILKEEWPDAVSFEFDRRAAAVGTHAVTEVLDIAPRHLREGTYLLRLEVEDLTTSRSAGRATIAFEVRG